MTTGLRIEQRLGQSLVMTPQLQQAIKLLQLSNLDLLAFVDQELERNPLLERAPPEGDAADASASDVPFRKFEQALSDDPDLEGDAADTAQAVAQAGEQTSYLDTDYDDIHVSDRAIETVRTLDSSAVAFGPGGQKNFGETQFFRGRLTRSKGLREHIEEQIVLEVEHPTDRLICVHLIDQLEESGYFFGDTEAIGKQLGCDPDRVEHALCRLQGCEPAGVFARSLAECLTFQLKDRGRLTREMRLLLDNLDLLGKRDLAGLAERCAIPEDQLIDLVRELRALDPKPGLAFNNDIVQTVIPDVFVSLDASGNWAVALNSDTLPRVLVDIEYYATVKRAVRTRAEKTFIHAQFQSANWLVRALDQRAQTILKVTSELVRQQDAFFAGGVRHLRPMTLRDIAEQVDMHESTVSRVTSNKFMATPHGIFELKYFFSSAIPGKSGAASHSAESVRHLIKELIEKEPSDDVRSDDRLVAMLGSRGIDIARRTVAKYRESLRIPSSVQRRRLKSARI